MAENQEGSLTPLRDLVNARKNAASDPRELRYMKEREGGTGWEFPNSPLLEAYRSFDYEFKNVVPEEFTDIKDYIEKTLGSKKGNAIAIELGGVGSGWSSDFTPGFFKRTAGVSLTDFRDRIDPSLKPADEQRNHKVITGDMVAKETKSKVQEFLAGEKADLIFLKMVAGLDSLPQEEHILANQADYWYQNLADGGLAFCVLPYDLIGRRTREWVELISEKYKGKLEVEFDDVRAEAIRLRKLPGAPARLPLVPIPELKSLKVVA